MFKELSLEELKKSELIFDINREPPTLKEISNRKDSFPNIKKLKEKNVKTNIRQGTIGLILSWIFWIFLIFNLLFFNFLEVKEPINFLEVVMVSSWPAILTNFLYLFTKKNNFYENILSYINSELYDIEELDPSDYAEMISFCKNSKACSDYKDKIVKQGRNFVKKEYDIFEEQIVNIDKYDTDKNILFSLGDLNKTPQILEKKNYKEGYVI